MCINHGLRHINPEIARIVEEMTRLMDRGSEENVQHIIGEVLEGIVWAGFLAYTLDVVSGNDADLYDRCIKLYESNTIKRHEEMLAWAAAHPEAHVRTLIVRSDTFSLREVEGYGQ